MAKNIKNNIFIDILNFLLFIRQIVLSVILKKSVNSYFFINNKKIHFKNLNSYGILNKNIDEINDVRLGIYKDVDLFIDIGAHIGSKSFLFNQINATAKIICIEPSDSITFLKKNLKHINNKRIYQYAISNKNTVSTLYYDENHLDVASLNNKYYFLKKNAKSIRSKKVKSRKLKDIIKCDRYNSIYLKIDVESMEDKVIIGAQEILKTIKYLEIEITQNDEKYFSDTIDLILKTGRKFNIICIDQFTDNNKIRAINLLLKFR